MTGDIQYLFTEAKECKFTKPNKFLFVPVRLNWKEKKVKAINVSEFNGEHKTAST